VSPELHRQVAMAAAEANESMNAWIAKALEGHVAHQKAMKTVVDGGGDTPSLTPYSA
jgi:hypothetical protein